MAKEFATLRMKAQLLHKPDPYKQKFREMKAALMEAVKGLKYQDFKTGLPQGEVALTEEAGTVETQCAEKVRALAREGRIEPSSFKSIYSEIAAVEAQLGNLERKMKREGTQKAEITVDPLKIKQMVKEFTLSQIKFVADPPAVPEEEEEEKVAVVSATENC